MVLSHCSAYLGKFIPGCLEGGSTQLLIQRFKRSIADSILAEEQWTSTLPLWRCWRDHGSLGLHDYNLNQVYMGYMDLEKAYDQGNPVVGTAGVRVTRHRCYD